MSNNLENPGHSADKHIKNPEVVSESEATLHKERIREQLERAGEKSPEENKETEARHEALKQATSLEKEEKQRVSPSIERRKDGPLSKKKLDQSYTATMQEVQSQMTPSERAFSKVIHNKAIERTSEVAGNTFARPNALLSGAIFAFVITLSIYLIAKNIGFPLSGFESISAFILGWTIGLLFDFLKVMITGRK
jgi:hypothetical protein